MCVYMYIHTYMYICMYIYVCVYLCVCVYMCMCVYIYMKDSSYLIDIFVNSNIFLSVNFEVQFSYWILIILYCVVVLRRRQWHPTPVLLPGKSHGRRSLVGCSHGVAKSWAWLSDFTFTFNFHALEKEMATHSSVLAWRIPGTEEPGRLPSKGSHRVGHDWSYLAAAAAAYGVGASLVAHLVKNPPAVQETPIRFLGQEDLLEKGLATHSSILELSWCLGC